MSGDNNKVKKTEVVQTTNDSYQGLTPGSFITDDVDNCVYYRLKALPEFVYKCDYPSARKLLSAKGWLTTQTDPELQTDEIFAAKITQVCTTESYEVSKDFEKATNKFSFEKLIVHWSKASPEVIEDMILDVQVFYGIFIFFRLQGVFTRLQVASSNTK